MLPLLVLSLVLLLGGCTHQNWQAQQDKQYLHELHNHLIDSGMPIPEVEQTVLKERARLQTLRLEQQRMRVEAQRLRQEEYKRQNKEALKTLGRAVGAFSRGFGRSRREKLTCREQPLRIDGVTMVCK